MKVKGMMGHHSKQSTFKNKCNGLTIGIKGISAGRVHEKAIFFANRYSICLKCRIAVGRYFDIGGKMKLKKLLQILFICVVLQLTGELRAKTCYMSFFYETIFQQTPLQFEPDDNPILVAESDPLTALGKTAVCKEGCTTSHTNNGRFDLLLRNTAAKAPDQAPLSLRINQIRLGFEDIDGSVSSAWVQIETQQIAACFGTPISFKKSRPFNAAGGHSANPEFLEPGEGIIGCVCLSQKDRRKTGKALIEVIYEPVVWMRDVSENLQTETVENKILWKAQHKISDIGQDDIRFYNFTVPEKTQDPSDMRIFLDNSQGLEIYTRRADHAWSQNIQDWQAGELILSGENTGRTFFVLVRSTGDSASGILRTEYKTGKDFKTGTESIMPEKDVPVFEPTPVGPPSTRIFKAHALGSGEKGDKASHTPPCCAGPN